jgi:hypothetical protein
MIGGVKSVLSPMMDRHRWPLILGLKCGRCNGALVSFVDVLMTGYSLARGGKIGSLGNSGIPSR